MKLNALARYSMVIGFISLCVSCSDSMKGSDPITLDKAAESYVKLGLQFGQYDTDYVDAYLGPSVWAEQAATALSSKEELSKEISELYALLQNHSPASKDQKIRHSSLLRNVRALDTRARMSIGEIFSFADEASLIYDLTLPSYDFNEFDTALNDIAELFPGDGELADRIAAFMESLQVPDDKRDAVMNLAIEECRRRTEYYIDLPEDERFTLEYVTAKSWTAYNWYQGKNESLLQINRDIPLRVSGAIATGCHEGYPGHHVWNVLVENRLLNERGWIENSIFPLYSPYALIAEGSANYGVNMAFPSKEKEAYEREVLYPAAGIESDKAEILAQLNKLNEKLSFANLATAQLYLDGLISRTEAVEQRRKYGLMSKASAEQNVDFIEQYRAYVVNYSLGQDIIRNHIEKQGDDPAIRWNAFEEILTSLLTASDLN